MTASQPGDRVAGRYVLERQVGEGGMGVVWRAADTLLARTVALKRVVLAGRGDADAALARDRFSREARIAARVDHPDAIKIYDVVQDGAESWLVLEYLQSRSLAELIDERGSLPPLEVARIGEAVASALAEAHRVGVVHRDVKPGNVLVGADDPGDRDRSGPVKLTDFGISRLTGDPTLTAAGLTACTPAYSAPEVAAGEEATAASDVFGLGATLYAAVEGRPPFVAGGDNNPLQVLRLAAEGRFPPPTRAGALTGPLLALLDRDPARRPDARQAARTFATVAVMLRATGGTRPQPPRAVRGALGPLPPPATLLPAPPRLPAGQPGRPAGSATPGRPGSAVGARTPGGPGTPGGTPPAVPVPGATPPAGSRRGGPSRRRRGPLVALTALLVAVLAGVTLVVVRFVDRETPAPQPVVAVPGPCDTSKGDLVIGVIVSQTGEAAEGLGGRPNGADLALRQANERCAVPGHKLVARLVDDRSTTDGAASAAKELAGEPNLVGVVLSTQYADVAQSAQAALAELDTATVAAWNSSAPLTLGDDFLVAARRPAPWFFRIVAPDSTVGRFAADEIVRLGGRRSVAVVDDDRDQGRTVADAFARHAAELGAKIVARERLSGDDPGPVVERLRKAERPDIIFYGGVPATGGKLSAQVGKAGLNVPVASGVYDTSFVDNGARTGDQAFYFTLPRTAIASEYDTAYKRAGYPDSISNVSALVYDATNVVVAGVADAVAPTGDWSTERRTAVVAAVQRSRTDGVTGLLAFDEFGDLTEPRLTEFEVRDGQLEAVVTRTYR